MEHTCLSLKISLLPRSNFSVSVPILIPDQQLSKEESPGPKFWNHTPLLTYLAQRLPKLSKRPVLNTQITTIGSPISPVCFNAQGKSSSLSSSTRPLSRHLDTKAYEIWTPTSTSTPILTFFRTQFCQRNKLSTLRPCTTFSFANTLSPWPSLFFIYSISPFQNLITSVSFKTILLTLSSSHPFPIC